MEAPRQVLTLEDCLQVARKHFGSEDVEVSNWRERKLSDKPAGYLGEHLLADIEASSGDKHATISVFVKTIPTNKNQASLIETTGAFRKEMLFYQQIFRVWEERGIITNKTNKNEANEWNCRCYLARDGVIILENLALLGFASDSARNPFDFEHTRLALKTLASYHAASIIYEEQRSKELKKPFRIPDEFPDLTKETFYIIEDGHPGEKTTEAGVEGVTACALLLPICENPNIRQRVKDRLPALLRRMYSAVRTSQRFRNVLCHADLWQNNILVRRSNGRPVDVKLVDYQLLRYVPPAHDIFDLIYLSTRREMRDAHEAELLDGYYTALGVALRRRDVNIEDVLPRAEFDASLEDQRLAGMLSGAYVLHFILSDSESVGPVFDDPAEYAKVVWEGSTRSQYICRQFNRDRLYREHYEEVLMELIEKHIL